MKSIYKKKFTKKSIIISGVIVLLIVGALVYVYAFNGNQFDQKPQQKSSPSSINAVDYGPPTSEQQKSGSDIKSNSSNSSDTPPAPTPIPGSSKKNVQMTITAANQNGSTLQIRVLIGAVENTGTCTLALTSTGRPTVKKTAGTQALASTSTCQGFDIPMSELSAGTWQALITYDSSTLTGSATKSITLQ